MVVLGLLLLIVAIVFGVDVIFGQSHYIVSPTIFGNSLGIHSDVTLFILGAITGAVILLGLAMLLTGLRHQSARAVSRRRERKAAERTRVERDALAADNEQLKSEIEYRQDGFITSSPRSGSAETIDKSIAQPGGLRARRRLRRTGV